jgi:GMP synthase PP-ATPase subunit
MEIKEIVLEKLDIKSYIQEKVSEISSIVGDGLAINALSGGVDSSAVTMLAHKVLGEKLKTYFVDSGLMREGEPQRIVALFREMGVPVELMLKTTSLMHSKDLPIRRRKGKQLPGCSTRRYLVIWYDKAVPSIYYRALTIQT